MTGFGAILWAVALGSVGQAVSAVRQDTDAETLQRSEDPSSVQISRMHVIFERKSSTARVSQILLLKTEDGTVFSNPRGYVIPLPKGASGAGAMMEEDAKIAVFPDHIDVIDPIGPQGIQVSFMFELPTVHGTVTLEQRLQGPSEAAQAVTMWTQGNVEIRGDGFGEPQLYTSQSGIQGLAVMGLNLAGKPLRVVVAGWQDGPESHRRLLTLALCIALLAAGLSARAIRAVGSMARGHAQPGKPSR